MGHQLTAPGDFDPTLLEFPCEYTVKALGRASDDFGDWVARQIEAQGPICSAVEVRPSRAGRFVAINATFTAQSLEQLQRINQALQASDRVTLLL